MNKEKYLQHLKLICDHHTKEAFNWGEMRVYSAAHEHSLYAQCYRTLINDIESNEFDKEVTPCKNATPATTE